MLVSVKFSFTNVIDKCDNGRAMIRRVFELLYQQGEWRLLFFMRLDFKSKKLSSFILWLLI